MSGSRKAEEADTFRRALGVFATGVCVVTVDGVNGPVGLTTNAITSVSLEPPMFLACFAAQSRTLAVLRDARQLAVSVLRSDAQHVAERFASKLPAAEKFNGLRTEQLGGVTVLADAAAVFVGAVEQLITAGDHEIAICATTALRSDPAAQTLLFHHGRFAALTP